MNNNLIKNWYARFCIVVLLLSPFRVCLFAESETTVQSYFKVKELANAGGDYRKLVILLHEAYDGSHYLNSNFAMGTLFASRGSVGSWNIKRAVQVSTGSAYRTNHGSFVSMDMKEQEWALVEVDYMGTRYLALEPPYEASIMPYVRFEGFHKSTAEGLKTIAYYDTRNGGTVLNQEIHDSITPFAATMTQTIRSKKSIFKNDVEVAGTIRAEEIIVEAQPWADYVFEDGYELPSLVEVEAHIEEHGRLPDMPSAGEVKEGGVSLGDSQRLLLQKIEELTLYAIEQRKLIAQKDDRIASLEQRLAGIEQFLGVQ